MNFRKMKRNFRRNTKAISPVIATLLMIAIAVVASLVTYAWVMGYMNFTTSKSSAELRVQSMTIVNCEALPEELYDLCSKHRCWQLTSSNQYSCLR